MARILGIDFGTRRVGIAATDPEQILVSPVTTVNTRDALAFILGYVGKEPVSEIVFGHPGAGNPEVLKALERFVARVKAVLPDMVIAYQDEQFTSRKAVRLMVESGLPKKKRRQKEVVDRISAVLILQEYLGHLNDVVKV